MALRLNDYCQMCRYGENWVKEVCGPCKKIGDHKPTHFEKIEEEVRKPHPPINTFQLNLIKDNLKLKEENMILRAKLHDLTKK